MPKEQMDAGLPRSAEQLPKAAVEKTDDTIVKGREAFIEALEGWMRSPDGEDMCSDCWKGYLSKFDASEAELIKKESFPTSIPRFVSTLKCGNEKKSDGWFVVCKTCAKIIEAEPGE